MLTTAAERGVRRRRQRRRLQVPIVPPWHPPVPDTLFPTEGRTLWHWHGEEGAGVSRRRRRRRRSRRVIFRALLCMTRAPGFPPPTRDDTAPCGGCILPACDPSTAGAAATTSAGGGGVGDDHEYYRSFLSFVRSDLSCHLWHIDAERADAMEGLLMLLYVRVDDGFPGRIWQGYSSPGGRHQRRREVSRSRILG